LGIYDIYGFVIAVEGPADKIFHKEYGYFKVSKDTVKIDLFVKPVRDQKNPPVKSVENFEGIYIPFANDEKVLLYDEAALNKVAYYCECLMWWPSKTFLHAGGVAKNGKAIVFTGAGGVGKTSIVLNLLKKGGYDFLGDDWLIIEGNKAFAFPRRIHIFHYNLKDKEIAERALGWRRFYYKPKLKLFELGRKLAPHKYLKFTFDILLKRSMISVDIQKLFPKVKIAPPSTISKIFYLERKRINELEIKRDITPRELARRMVHVNMSEQMLFFRKYCEYVYSYGIENSQIANRMRHDFEIMYETFRNSEIYRITVPEHLDLTRYPLPSIFDV